LKNRHVDVSKRVVDLAGHLDHDQPKTEEAIRVVPVPHLVARELAQHVKIARLSIDDPLFPAPQGGHARYHNWRRRVWHPAVDRVDLVDPVAGRFQPHGLRKTAITVWLDAGVAIEEAAAWCGHRNITIMYKHYKARQAEGKRAQISKVDAVLEPGD
jgi:integrase